MVSVNKEHRTCIICGTDFRRPYRSSFKGWNKRKYCSQECYRETFKGKRSRNWKGGRKVNPNGYVELYLPEHPHSDSQGYVREHIVVMCEFVNRSLSPDEVVHHRNETRDDNRLSNLLLIKKGPHVSLHNKGKTLSEQHRNKISWNKIKIAHLIQRNELGQFKGGIKYGE